MDAGRTQGAARAARGISGVAGAIVLAVTLSACGPSRVDDIEPSVGVDDRARAVPAIPLPDSCTLLTTSQIKAAANVILSEGSPNAEMSGANRSVCEWASAGNPSPFIQVLVAVGADSIAEERASAEASLGVSEEVGVVGGGSAYTVANGSVLGMRVGDYFVQVTYVAGDSADVGIVTSALAQDVAKAL
jgi:hypothetical protein